MLFDGNRFVKYINFIIGMSYGIDATVFHRTIEREIMRAYLVDEISLSDMKKAETFLKKNAISSSLDKIFWVEIPFVTEIQQAHSDCMPHVFGIELGVNWIKLEFFIRSLNNMRCNCPGYSNKQQSQFIIDYAQRLIDKLDLKT